MKRNPIAPAIKKALFRLELNLEKLPNHCKPGYRPLDDDTSSDDSDHWRLRRRSAADIAKFGCWPKGELLRELEADVLVLAGRKGAIFPVWDAFELVNQRKKKLRLKSSVNDLIRRAQRLLSGEFELNKVVRLAKTVNAQDQGKFLNMLPDDPQKFDELLQADRQLAIQRDRSV